MIVLSSVTSHGLSFQDEAVHGYLPVAGVGVDIHVGHLAFVERRVGAAQDHFSTQLRLRVPAEPEGEDGLHQALLHHGVEGRHHVEDGQRGVAHPQDPVNPGPGR